MPSALKFSVSARNAGLQAVIDLIEADTAIFCYVKTGSPPSLPEGAPTSGSGIVLWTGIESVPGFSTPSNGSTTIAFTQQSVSTAGIAGHFRIAASSPFETVCQGTCGDSTDAPVDLEFNDKNLTLGALVEATLTITMPE